MQLNQLLVVIDPTSKDSQPSLERAAWVAKRSQSAVELLICEYNSVLDGGFFFVGPAQQKARGSQLNTHSIWLDKLSQPLRDQGLSVSTEVRWGYPLHSMVLQPIDEVKPDLVFRDATTHSLLQRLF